MPILYGLFPLWVKPFEIICQPHNSVLFAIFLATKGVYVMPILYGLFTFWVKPFEIFCQPHSSVLLAVFLATERCLCYANLVWIIYILSQAFRNLLSTTQLSFVCCFLSNWKVSMLCQTCMDYFHYESSLSKSFVNHTTQFCLLFS